MNALGTVLNIHGKELGSILWRHWIKKYPDLASMRFRILSGFKHFHIWRADPKGCGFVWRIHRIRVDGSRIRKEKVADPKISEYVWRGPNSFLNLDTVLDSLQCRRFLWARNLLAKTSCWNFPKIGGNGASQRERGGGGEREEKIFSSSPPLLFPSFALAPTVRVTISSLPNLPLS